MYVRSHRTVTHSCNKNTPSNRKLSRRVKKKARRSKKKRCPNGTRRHKKTGKCEKVSRQVTHSPVKMDYDIFSPIPPPRTIHTEYSPTINKYLLEPKTLSPVGAQGCPLDEIRITLSNGSIKCFPSTSKEAKDLMLRNLRSKTPIKCKEIIAPKQFKSNCWFNSFFMIFFISDKGKKFNKWMREAMITGKIMDSKKGRDVVSKLRLPLFILNKYIDASTRNTYDPTNFANLMDTNDIIRSVNNAIGDEGNRGIDGTLIAPVDTPSNPMRFYKGLYNALGGDAMPWIPLTINKLFKHSDISHFYEMLSRPTLNKRISKMIYIEIADESAKLFEKPLKFTIDMVESGKSYHCTYKLDSAVLRDINKEHFSSYITCNGKGLGSDGDAKNRLQIFDWKKRLNKSGKWKLAEDYYTMFDFTKGYQILIYYLTNKTAFISKRCRSI
jgi:hypothetical protein